MAGAVPLEIGVADLAQWRQGADAPAILDVREPWELALCRIDGSIDIPMGQVPDRLAELPSDRRLVVMCHHGMRSMQVTQWLRMQGYDSACNLQGGIDAWASQIDLAMKRY
jgi:rhodanese-related sulfurtransferase